MLTFQANNSDYVQHYNLDYEMSEEQKNQHRNRQLIYGRLKRLRQLNDRDKAHATLMSRIDTSGLVGHDAATAQLLSPIPHLHNTELIGRGSTALFATLLVSGPRIWTQSPFTLSIPTTGTKGPRSAPIVTWTRRLKGVFGAPGNLDSALTFGEDHHKLVTAMCVHGKPCYIYMFGPTYPLYSCFQPLANGSLRYCAIFCYSADHLPVGYDISGVHCVEISWDSSADRATTKFLY